MNWITQRDLLLIHSRVIDVTGGKDGLINTGVVESAVARPFTRFGDQEMFPTLLEKVAAMIHSIIAFHPFEDGNKRTGLVAGDVVLRMHGLRIIPSREVEEFFWSIARGEQDVPQISNWLAGHTGPAAKENME